MQGEERTDERGHTRIPSRFSPKEEATRGEKLKMIDRKRSARNKRVEKAIIYTLVQVNTSMLICKENDIILMGMKEERSRECECSQIE